MEEASKKWIVAYVGVFFLDLITNLILFFSIHDWSVPSWTGLDFFKAILAFQTDTLDCIFMTLFRTIVITSLSIIGIKLGSPDFEAAAKQRNNTSNIINESSEPLLSFSNRNPPTPLSDQEKMVLTQIATKKKNIIFVIMFIIFTWAQMQIGIKMIGFHFQFEALQAALMGSSIVWINLEQYLSKQLVSNLTKESGYLFKELHPHRLYYDDTVAGHFCDVCRNRIRKGYRCKMCDFDLCQNCFNRKDKSRGEGVIRGDKGMKKELDLSVWTYIIRAIKLLTPHTWLILAAVICLLTSSASNLLLPNYQGKILDNVISGNNAGFLESIRFYIALSIASGFFGAIRSLCFSVVGSKMANDLRNKLFESVMIQDIAFFDGMQTGELLSRLSNEVGAMVAPCRTALATFLTSSLGLVGGLFMCFYTSWRLSVLALTSIGPIVQIISVYSKWSRIINKEIWAALGDSSSVANQAISNIRTVRAFGTERREIKNYFKATHEALTKGIKDAFASAGTYALTNYLDMGTGVLLLWYGGSLAISDNPTLTLGQLITFQLYWNMINSSYNGLIGILAEFTRAAGAAQRVLTLMDILPDIPADYGKHVDRAGGDFRLESVSFFYQMRPDSLVLKNVSFSIPKGKVTALVGKSGGGKSTMIHLLMRFYDPSQGQIYLDGIPLTDINLRSLRKQMAIVAQDTQLFSTTIEENIAYSVDSYTQETLIEAAKLANAHDFISSFDEGYQTRVGERGVRLSGGQKQRIAIARAILRRPPILFLDEATSSLDTESEAQVQQAIDNLIKLGGCTVILVAHRLSTVINADKIAVLDGGSIVEEGKHEELMALQGIYFRLVQKQLERQNKSLYAENNE